MTQPWFKTETEDRDTRRVVKTWAKAMLAGTAFAAGVLAAVAKYLDSVVD